MAYTITRSDGTVLTTVSDGTINTTTSSLALPGKNYSGYGQYQNINAIRQVENFAAPTPPKYPLKGQLWFNTTDNTLRLCPADGTTNASSWLLLSTSTSAGNARLGNLIVSGNLSVGNIISTSVTADTGSFSVLNATTQLNAAAANLVIANIGTLNTTLISAGSATSPGTLLGDWTVNNSIHIANTAGGTSNAMMNINGVYASSYHFANGAPFVTYTNANVYEYLNGSSTVVRFNGNIAPTNIQATSAAITDITSTNSTFTNCAATTVTATTVHTDVLTSNTATIDTLGVSTTLTAATAFATTLTATHLSGTDASYSTVNASTSVTSPIGALTAVTSTTTNTGTLTVSGLTTTGNINVTSNVVTANLTATNATVTTGAITTLTSTTMNTTNMNAVTAGATHITGVNDITAGGSGGVFNGIWTLATGARLQATYADFAERYASDSKYEPGTVVQLGGTHEITAAIDDASNDVFGVVTTNPAHVLNAGAGDDITHPAIALIGRTPVKVIGMVSKFARLVSAGNGLARQAHPSEITAFNVIGRSIEAKTDIGIGIVEAVVKIA